MGMKRLLLAGGAALLLAGPALAVKTAPGDNLMVHKALDLAHPGDVIVVENHARYDAAGWGGILSNGAQVRGVAGVIVDGAARDIEAATQRVKPAGALEDPHGSPAIDHRPIEQPRPIGALEVRFNEIKVLLGLLRRQHVVDHGMNHRKQAVAKTGFMIQRMQQIGHSLGILEIDVARDHPIDQKVLSKISQNFFGFNFHIRCLLHPSTIC